MVCRSVDPVNLEEFIMMMWPWMKEKKSSLSAAGDVGGNLYLE